MLHIQRDPLADQAAQQFGDIRDRIRQLDNLRAQGLAAGEGQKLAHQRRGAVGILLDLHDVREGRIAGAMLQQQQITIADDGGEHIVEIVRHPAGQMPHRLQSLGLGILGLDRLLLGGFHGAQRHRPIRTERRAIKTGSPPVHHHLAYRSRRTRLSRGGQEGFDQIAILLPHRLKQRRACRRRLGTEHTGKGGIHPLDPACSIHNGQRQRRAQEELVESRIGGCLRLRRCDRRSRRNRSRLARISRQGRLRKQHGCRLTRHIHHAKTHEHRKQAAILADDIQAEACRLGARQKRPAHQFCLLGRNHLLQGQAIRAPFGKPVSQNAAHAGIGLTDPGTTEASHSGGSKIHTLSKFWAASAETAGPAGAATGGGSGAAAGALCAAGSATLAGAFRRSSHSTCRVPPPSGWAEISICRSFAPESTLITRLALSLLAIAARISLTAA